MPIKKTGFNDFLLIVKDNPYAMHKMNANSEPMLLSIAHASDAAAIRI